MLQTGRSWVRFPDEVIETIDLIPPAALWPLRRLSLTTLWASAACYRVALPFYLTYLSLYMCVFCKCEIYHHHHAISSYHSNESSSINTLQVL
jgi:hypothetical protein